MYRQPAKVVEIPPPELAPRCHFCEHFADVQPCILCRRLVCSDHRYRTCLPGHDPVDPSCPGGAGHLCIEWQECDRPWATTKYVARSWWARLLRWLGLRA